MKKSKDREIFNLNQDKDRVSENLENSKDKLAQLFTVQTENEKLKNKIKDLQILKDKNTENTTLLNTLDSKERIIDTLTKENANLAGKYEKIEEEFSAEKKKNNLISKDYENFMVKFNELNDDYSRIKKFLDRKSIKIDEENRVALDFIDSDNNFTGKNRRRTEMEKNRISKVDNCDDLENRNSRFNDEDLKNNNINLDCLSEGSSNQGFTLNNLIPINLAEEKNINNNLKKDLLNRNQEIELNKKCMKK